MALVGRMCSPSERVGQLRSRMRHEHAAIQVHVGAEEGSPNDVTDDRHAKDTQLGWDRAALGAMTTAVGLGYVYRRVERD